MESKVALGGKQLSHFTCPGPLLLVLVNDFIQGRLAWILVHWLSEL